MHSNLPCWFALALVACGTPAPRDPPDPTECAQDGDGDGFSACDDCDDADAAVHPGAAEIWYDGVDADCDGADDDDQDGDGDRSLDHGGLDCDDLDPARSGLDLDGDSVSSCAGDCDDADPAVLPGAARVCGDGIDNDCDGLGDCQPLGLHALPEAGLPALLSTAERIGECCKLPAGDLGGPTVLARSELLTGELYVFPTEWTGTIDTTAAIATLPGGMSDYADFTGDGIPDVVTLTSAFGGGPGPIHMYPGPHNGTYSSNDAPVVLVPTSGYQAGITAFDHDGDGTYGVIGTTDRGSFNFGAPMEQTLYYIPELVDGAGIEAVTAVLYADTADGIPVAGESTADLLGNGSADLLAMDHYEFKAYIIEGSSLVGNKSLSEAATVTITDCFSPRLAGDLNDDGYADLSCVLGVGPATGMRILFGPFTSDRDGDLDTDITLTYPLVGVSPGDVNGDGASDLLIVKNELMLFYGPFPSGTVIDADIDAPAATYTSIATYTYMALVGDVNQDGFADFWVNAGSDYFLIYGGSSTSF